MAKPMANRRQKDISRVLRDRQRNQRGQLTRHPGNAKPGLLWANSAEDKKSR